MSLILLVCLNTQHEFRTWYAPLFLFYVLLSYLLCSHIFSLSYSYTVLIQFYFIYLFSRQSFSYLCSLYLSCIQLLLAAEKLNFPTEIISFLPHLPIKLHSGLQHTVSLIRIYCTVAQWFWFSASKTMRCTLITLVRGVKSQRNELWHQSLLLFSSSLVSIFVLIIDIEANSL